MKVFHRIYSDYLMPSRMNEYEALIKFALENDYLHLTIPEFFKIIENDELKNTGKIFIHRHDIDTDAKTAERFFEIEKKHRIKTSYYFRLSTWNVQLIKKIATYGSEVGYHYEELAQYCKDNNLNRNEVRNHYPAIREQFKKNLLQLETRTGMKIKTIASHGDFVNRKINIANYDFVTQELTQKLGVDFECYDKKLIDNYNVKLSDTLHPEYYKPRNPFDCIKDRYKIIYLLTHPRHWRKNILANSVDNLKRMWEGIHYSH